MNTQFDLRMLENIMDLGGSNYSIKPWNRIHFQSMFLNPFDEKSFELFPSYIQHLEHYAQTGIALSGFVEEQCYTMWGMVPLHPGVAEAWLLPSKYISKHKFAFHRATKNFLLFMMGQWKLHRLQILVDSANTPAIKWAEVLSFQKEGVLKRYGVDKTDFIMYARSYKKLN